MTYASLGAQEDIIPAWEDVANKNGGKWSVQLPKEKTKTIIDQMWLYTVSHFLLSQYAQRNSSADTALP